MNVRFLLFFSTIYIVRTNQPSLIKGLVDVPPNSDFIGENIEKKTNTNFDLYTKKIHIGGIFSLTNKNGEIREEGISAAIGFYCGIQQINKSGMLGETEIVMDLKDGESDPGKCVDLAKEFLSSKYIGLIGPDNSYETFPLAAYFGSNRFPIISPGAMSIELNSQKWFPTFLRTITGHTNQMNSLCLVLRHFNWTLITGLFSNDYYGMSGHIAFLEATFNNEIRPTCTWILNGYTLKDAQNVANCLENSDSNVVLLFIPLEEISNFLGHLYKSLTKKIVLIASDSWGSVDNYRRNIVKGNFPVEFLENMISVMPTKKENTYIKNYVNEMPNTGYLKKYREYKFRCLYTDDTSIPACNQNIDNREPVEKNQDAKCRCLGTEILDEKYISYEADYVADSTQAYAEALLKIRTDCQSLGSEFCNLKTVNGDIIHRAIQKMQFEGITGSVSFDGNIRKDGINIVMQYSSEENKQKKIGICKNTELKMDSNIDIDNLVSSEVIPSTVGPSSFIGIIVIILSLIGIGVTIWVGIEIYQNREEQVIRKASPVFCELILFGIFLGFLSMVFWTFESNTFTCLLRIWTLAMGFALITGNLLAKTYRIFKIFTNVKVTSLVISDKQLLYFSGAIVLTYIILMSIYSFASPGVPTDILVQSTVDTLYKYVVCLPPNYKLHLTLLVIIILLCFVLTTAGVIIAYLTRKVDSSFNESREISFTMYTYLLLACIIIPLYFTSGDSRGSVERQYILRSFSIIIALFGSVYFLFGQKLTTLHEEKEERRQFGEATTVVDETTTKQTSMQTVGTTKISKSGKPKKAEWLDESKGIFEA